MGFPVETMDGETILVEKVEGGKLVAADGSVYKPNAIDALKVELVEAKEAIEEAVEEVIDAVEAVGDLLDGEEDAPVMVEVSEGNPDGLAADPEPLIEEKGDGEEAEAEDPEAA